MLLSLILSILTPDPCRSLALVYADPDRTICPVEEAGPLFPWEVPPDGQ